jgi:plastocyanin
MTWLWRISFSCAAALALDAATVTGRVELSGSKRKDPGRSGVVVSLWPAAGGAASATPRRATMVQKNKTFQPHVLAIQVGTTVDFPNYDPIYHNAFSNYDGQVFDVSLYPPGSTRSVHFRRPGIVRVFCNIHSSMSAVIVVLPTPYHATTRADGAFEIAGVPPGEYTMHVFHERAAPSALAALERRVEISGAAHSLGAISISETGYIPVPHRNKYGREYGPEPVDGPYPSGGK